MANVRVILASQSPRRRDLLTLIGIPHTVQPADIDETPHAHEPPIECVQRLARTKAAVVAAIEPDALVIGADTIVVMNNEMLNKPTDARDAERMLQMLQGRRHMVYTAVAVAWQGQLVSHLQDVVVWFRPISDADITTYVATGEPMDKAGAYGIQGYGATLVELIEGDFFAVMGLPLVTLTRLMAQVGVYYDFGHISCASAPPSPTRPKP